MKRIFLISYQLGDTYTDLYDRSYAQQDSTPDMSHQNILNG